MTKHVTGVDVGTTAARAFVAVCALGVRRGEACVKFRSWGRTKLKAFTSRFRGPGT